MENERWYAKPVTDFLKYLGYAVLASGIGIGAGQIIRAWDRMYIESEKNIALVEMKRLEAIREITDNYGWELSAPELSDFLKQNNLNERK